MQGRAWWSPLAGDSANAARANVFGGVTVVPPGEEAAVRELYLSKHPESAQWVNFGDFAFYALAVRGAYWVGGFGEMGWVPGGGLLAGCDIEVGD